MTEQPQASVKKRPSRTRRWAKIAALVIAALVLLAFVGCGALMLWGSMRIEREIEAVKALHEPTNWDELLRTDRQGHVLRAPETPVERDAAALYSRALAQSKGWNKALPQEFFTRIGKERLSAGEVQQLGEALAPYRDAIGLFRQAAQYDGIAALPEASIEPNQHQLDSIGALREAARLLSAQACYLAAQGQGDEAADTCILMLRYAHAFPGYNEITGLVHFALIGVACRTIEHTQTIAPSSAEKLDLLKDALWEAIDETPLSRIFCGERVCGNYLFQSGWVTLPRFSLWPNHAAYLEVMRKGVQASREPFPASLRTIKQVVSQYGKQIGPRYTFCIFARMLAPVLDSGLNQGAATQARVRTTLVSLAIRRTRLDGMPLPTSLQQLSPKYLSVIPTDPFTGETLRYRADESGATVYSVGPDGVDNGGEIKADAGCGGRPERDIGVGLSL